MQNLSYWRNLKKKLCYFPALKLQANKVRKFIDELINITLHVWRHTHIIHNRIYYNENSKKPMESNNLYSILKKYIFKNIQKLSVHSDTHRPHARRCVLYWVWANVPHGATYPTLHSLPYIVCHYYCSVWMCQEYHWLCWSKRYWIQSKILPTDGR